MEIPKSACSFRTLRMLKPFPKMLLFNSLPALYWTCENACRSNVTSASMRWDNARERRSPQHPISGTTRNMARDNSAKNLPEMLRSAFFRVDLWRFFSWSSHNNLLASLPVFFAVNKRSRPIVIRCMNIFYEIFRIFRVGNTQTPNLVPRSFVKIIKKKKTKRMA